MKAQEALRKGSKKFAEELQALTGKKDSVGPPPDFKIIGTKVEVMCKNQVNGKDEWYPATISNIQQVDLATNKALNEEDVTYEVTFTDNRTEKDMKKSRLRHIKLDTQVGGVLFLDEAYG